MKNIYMDKMIRIKLNKALKHYPAGAELSIRVDVEGTPRDKYWRDRFKDADIDNCVEVKNVKPQNNTK